MLRNRKDKGFSLIETIVGIFVLVMGVGSVVGVAIYSSAVNRKMIYKLTALGLAKEGVEVVRYTRDNSWLPPQTLGSCATLGADQSCYSGFLASLNPCIGTTCQAVLDPSTHKWSLVSNGVYALYLQSDGSYTPAGSGPTTYYRKITVTTNSAAPYTAQYPQLVVTSVVGWVGGSCPDFGTDPSSAALGCKITVQDHLTNWKNFQ